MTTTVRSSLAAILLAALALQGNAQQCPATDAADAVAIYPTPQTLLTYPLLSDQYDVHYKLDGGAWTNAKVHISIYGGTNASPNEPFTKYLPFTNYPSLPTESMSFVSIPARSNALVQLRVTKLGNGPFRKSDHVSVRPGAKLIPAALASDGTAQLSTFTGPAFAGEQFLLWWERDSQNGGAFQSLAFFLDPPYPAPTGANVQTITAQTGLPDSFPSSIDTLDFEGTFVMSEGNDPEGAGAQVYNVPATINNVYLGPGAWVQGKLQFTQSGAGHVRRIYGPGVLDNSRFNYVWRQCRNATDPVGSLHVSDGLQAVSWAGNPKVPDEFHIDGIVVSDIDYTATDELTNGTVNNMKVIGWNGNNDGLEMRSGTTASNVFIRAGDDSLEMWGLTGNITVTNATVWQNANGGVVNLGWLDLYPGDNTLIDGLYVVRTDWQVPATDPPWKITSRSGLNNGVIVSLLTPGSQVGTKVPPVYRNIFLDEAPRVFFSLKILPPDCQLIGLKQGKCPAVDITRSSVVDLNIENVFMPQSLLSNPIGFDTLPAGFTYEYPAGVTHTLASDYTMTGTMNIGLTNVFVQEPNGIWLPLLDFDAGFLGKITTSGPNVTVKYRLGLP